MNGAPSSTWFSTAPDWGWFIVLYFFLGGLAGGSYFLAALIDLSGRPEDRPLARLGYYVAFPCVVLSGMLLTADLGKPLRFWHMLIESNTYRPMFKYWSPMSIGAWALLVFGLFCFLSFLGALAEDEPHSPNGGRIRWPALRTIAARWPALHRLRPPSGPGRVIVVIGAIFGLYIAGYTGVLLAVTNRPIWSDTPLLGMLFVVSGASTSAALIILLAHRSGWTVPGLANLHRMEAWVITLELIVLVAVMVSLGPVLRAWLNAWGLLLLIVIILGMVAPMVLSWRARQMREWSMTTAAILVLVAGFLLRVIIVFSAESV
jgi:protein NrfD